VHRIPRLVVLTSMQHPRGIRGLVPGGVSVWTREQIVRLPPEEYRAMSALIDEAGVRSARAQGLPAPITSTVRNALPEPLPKERHPSDDR